MRYYNHNNHTKNQRPQLNHPAGLDDVAHMFTIEENVELIRLHKLAKRLDGDSDESHNHHHPHIGICPSLSMIPIAGGIASSVALLYYAYRLKSFAKYMEVDVPELYTNLLKPSGLGMIPIVGPYMVKARMPNKISWENFVTHVVREYNRKQYNMNKMKNKNLGVSPNALASNGIIAASPNVAAGGVEKSLPLQSHAIIYTTPSTQTIDTANSSNGESIYSVNDVQIDSHLSMSFLNDIGRPSSSYGDDYVETIRKPSPQQRRRFGHHHHERQSTIYNNNESCRDSRVKTRIPTQIINAAKGIPSTPPLPPFPSSSSSSKLNHKVNNESNGNMVSTPVVYTSWEDDENEGEANYEDYTADSPEDLRYDSFLNPSKSHKNNQRKVKTNSNESFTTSQHRQNAQSVLQSFEKESLVQQTKPSNHHHHDYYYQGEEQEEESNFDEIISNYSHSIRGSLISVRESALDLTRTADTLITPTTSSDNSMSLRRKHNKSGATTSRSNFGFMTPTSLISSAKKSSKSNSKSTKKSTTTTRDTKHMLYDKLYKNNYNKLHHQQQLKNNTNSDGDGNNVNNMPITRNERKKKHIKQFKDSFIPSSSSSSSSSSPSLQDYDIDKTLPKPPRRHRRDMDEATSYMRSLGISSYYDSELTLLNENENNSDDKVYYDVNKLIDQEYSNTSSSSPSSSSKHHHGNRHVKDKVGGGGGGGKKYIGSPNNINKIVEARSKKAFIQSLASNTF
ncbi:hypothetical protein H4219_006084 [Mycoemilia scoparia]|uniref:Uncharacterized protein n=1 Tax=Mycoemilia scoparia TaxID=417184 RepID=A0A9W7ZLA4_9FUNG|nr:hypothetical protein H4219_006084 [Mycoemilia scoparia]